MSDGRILCPECGARVGVRTYARHPKSRVHRVQVAFTRSARGGEVPLVGVRLAWREELQRVGVDLRPLPLGAGQEAPVPVVNRANLEDIANMEDVGVSPALMLYLDFLGRVADRVGAGEPWWHAIGDEPRPSRGE